MFLTTATLGFRNHNLIMLFAVDFFSVVSVTCAMVQTPEHLADKTVDHLAPILPFQPPLSFLYIKPCLHAVVPPCKLLTRHISNLLNTVANTVLFGAGWGVPGKFLLALQIPAQWHLP